MTAAMVARRAQLRDFDAAIIDVGPFVPGSGAGIDQWVLTNTADQMVLARAFWPFAGAMLFRVGTHLSPPLRGVGFAASFYPSVAAVLWAPAVSFGSPA